MNLKRYSCLFREYKWNNFIVIIINGQNTILGDDDELDKPIQIISFLSDNTLNKKGMDFFIGNGLLQFYQQGFYHHCTLHL